MKHTLYASVYTTYPPASGDWPKGLYIFRMDADTGLLVHIQAVDAGENPSFLALSEDGSRLYVANETRGGSVSAFAVNPTNGSLHFINRKPVQGDDPCYLSLSHSGKLLLAAGYSSGSLTVLPVDEEGALGYIVQRIQHTGSGPNSRRQEKAHVHCAMPAPGGKDVFVVDLGMDRVWVYAVDPKSGLLNTWQTAGLQTEPGAGPRHMAVHPNGKFIYLSNELDSTVTFCTWHEAQARLEAVQALSTLPDGFSGENTAADIHLTPDGKTLYISNRGDDSLAAFRLDEESGRMCLVGIFSCGGKCPRSFAIDPTGRFVLVANQHSGNLVVLRIDADGTLSATGEEASVPAPVCVIFGKRV